MDAQVTNSWSIFTEMLTIGFFVFIAVSLLLFIVLRWRPDMLRFDPSVQSSRMKEVTAELSTVKGQVSYLLGQLVVAEKKIRESEEENSKLKIKILSLETTVESLTKRVEEEEMHKFEGENSPLLVVVGSDEDLELDLASLRAVQTDTGMGFRRVTDATLEKVVQRMNRARINGRPYDKMHMSVHSGPEGSGVYLGKELVTGVELSEIMKGIKILLIAGCEGGSIGDVLGVVPFVVTISEEVSHGDAALFSRAFWTQIGKKRKPDDALRLALQLAPSGMDEYVEGHW